MEYRGITLRCYFCGKEVEKRVACVNRAVTKEAGIYCDKKCFGLDRRDHKTIEQRKAEKAAYDRKYRAKNEQRIKERVKRYNESPAGRAMQKRQREKKKDAHREYIRTPKYKAWKKDYDVRHRAKKNYGDYWESAVLLKKISDLVDNRLAKRETGIINKKQERKRSWKRSLRLRT